MTEALLYIIELTQSKTYKFYTTRPLHSLRPWTEEHLLCRHTQVPRIGIVGTCWSSSTLPVVSAQFRFCQNARLWC